MTDQEKAILFDWLMGQMAGHSLWMDGTRHWRLPATCLPHRASTPQGAVQRGKATWDQFCDEYAKSIAEKDLAHLTTPEK